MKIVTTKTETIEIEREITLPYFSRCGNAYYKIFGEGKRDVINVWNSPMVGNNAIQYCYVDTAFAIENWQEITADEFQKAFDECLKTLTA